MIFVFFQLWPYALGVSTQFRVVTPVCIEKPPLFEHQMSSTCNTEKIYGHGDSCHVECDTRIKLQCHCVDHAASTDFFFLHPDGCQWKFDNECAMKVQYSTATTTVQIATESLSYVMIYLYTLALVL